MKNKTYWLSIVKEMIQIAGGCVNLINRARAFSSFIINGVVELSGRSLAIGENATDVIDGYIKGLEFTEPQTMRMDLELVHEPFTVIINEIEQIICTYYLEHPKHDSKLVLTSIEGSIVEYAYFDNESKQFISPDEKLQIKINIHTRELVIIGKQYHNVQFEYIKHTLSIGINDLGVELTDRKLLTAAAVKKLIDNNLKHSLQNHTDSLANALANYMPKTNETTLTLNNGSETSNRKLVIYPVNDKQFRISLYTLAQLMSLRESKRRK